MPRRAAEFSALAVSRLKQPGIHFVGGVPGLALQVLPSGARTWLLRVVIGSRRRDMGLGGYPGVGLAGWRNPKHAQQWTNTLTTYAYPVMGTMLVRDIEVAQVLEVLEPIWTDKTETASRLRGRIESVLDWTTTRGYRQGSIRRAGAAISTSCCRRRREWRASSITKPCLWRRRLRSCRDATDLRGHGTRSNTQQ